MIEKDRQKYVKELEPQLKQLQEQEKLTNDLKAKKNSDKDIAEATEKFQKLYDEFKKADEEAGKKINEYKNLLYRPHLEKVNATIKKVAEKKKLHRFSIFSPYHWFT